MQLLTNLCSSKRSETLDLRLQPTMGKDYYKILNVPRNASEEEVRKGYKKMALKFHPDKNKSPEAEDRFKEIAEAYEVLSDPQKREVFDKYGEEGVKGSQPPGSGNVGFHHFEMPEGFTAFTFHGDPMSTFSRVFGRDDPFKGMRTDFPISIYIKRKTV